MSDVPARLLRETLRGRAATASTPDCLDPDTLARWADGALSARERAAAESHASSCAHCQALVAAMARTAPCEPERRPWHAFNIRWIVPLAVAAAAVLVWINLPMDRAPRASPAASAPLTASADRVLEPKKAEGASAPTIPQRAVPLSAAPPRSARREQRAQTATESAQSIAPRVAEPDAASAAESAVSPRRAMADRVMPPAAASFFGKAVAVRTIIVSPDANVRWRVATGGYVERTVDGGLTWQTQSTPAAALTAGSAPSPTVCWFVGPGGVVLLSTDGETWQRVSFPETIDLTSIRAADGSNATVTTADGRTFTTADGGKTWSPGP